ncbi:hypothetical protein MINS_14910 [Mycolicibacterium insubricum]|uniref:VWA domain-containing protein n=1 Tax=Mycolicibacterium insubricum TaxID=444597 RepID=UPI0009F4E7EC|nr:VWA domain-containing protein [Mycolicibacterium insubricum]MCB9441049.1 VWA domain-containing protein [Mycolicibacterium sp.]BBZ66062.1 hypothetical protein MINS_14910 [Mycolicibacterium insubricum]
MTFAALNDTQRRAWEDAQALWGVRLHDARQAPAAGAPSFAWFSFPPSITIDPVLAARLGVDTELATVFAHEIGHHVLSPSTRRGSLLITQQMARALTASSVGTVTRLADNAALAANLWSDLLINTRVVDLQRRRNPGAEPGMVRLWRILYTQRPDPLFWVILRACEDLWGLPDGTLCPTEVPAAPPPRTDGTETIAVADPALDSRLLARAARSFANDPVRGALRFGLIAAPYLLATESESSTLSTVPCAGDATADPPTAAELADVLRDPRLRELPVHPALESRGGIGASDEPPGAQGYGLAETLQLYATMPVLDVLTAWYTDRARPWIRPFREPAGPAPQSCDVPGALAVWEVDDDPALLDWAATFAASPWVIPGVTTRRREAGEDEPQHRDEPVELDLYIDSSGSMPRPERDSSALLAGAILVQSVLAGGGRVRVTSFSGPGQVAGTPRPTANRSEAISALLHYFGHGTSFPLDLLANRYARPGGGVRRHLAVISDDGLASFFGEGQQEYAGVAAAVGTKCDTATLILLDARRSTAKTATAAGYDVEYLDSMADAPAACARLAERIRRG